MTHSNQSQAPGRSMELHFTRTNGPADDAVDDLMDLVGGIRRPDLVREMILTALKAGQENRNPLDLKLMNTTVKELRFTAKAFGPYRDVKKVTVFGSARLPSDTELYRMARRFGRAVTEEGFMVITGGGAGVMQAANEGAGPEHSFGVHIRLPFENRPNPVLEGSPRNITYKYFFNRKVAFVKESDAVALFPGGFGTLDEAMETLTLVQTGKRNPVPIVLVDEPGGTYWSRWIDFLRDEQAEGGFIGESDFALFDAVDSVDAAVGVITRFYRRYHSVRQVGDRLVIRLKPGFPASRVGELADSFSDMLTQGGGMSLEEPLPEEDNEPGITHLDRLVVDFNRKDFGRLRMLIDTINDM